MRLLTGWLSWEFVQLAEAIIVTVFHIYSVFRSCYKATMAGEPVMVRP